MFDVSFTELLVIGVIALIVIGPERLPKVARTVGHLIGRAQRYVHVVKQDIQREMELQELHQFKADIEEAAQQVQTSLRATEVAQSACDEVSSTSPVQAPESGLTGVVASESAPQVNAPRHTTGKAT